MDPNCILRRMKDIFDRKKNRLEVWSTTIYVIYLTHFDGCYFFQSSHHTNQFFFFPKTNHPDLYHQGRTQNAGQSQTELGVFRITNALKMTYY